MKSKKPSILFISHDANRAGAQLFLFNIAEYFLVNKYKISILFLSSYGSLYKEFNSKFKCYFLDKIPDSSSSKFFLNLKIGQNEEEKKKLFLSNILSKNSIDIIYVNTIAATSILFKIQEIANFPILTHIHELEHSLNLYSTEQDRKDLVKYSTKVLACSTAVGKNLVENHHLNPENLETVHSFVDNESILKRSNKTEIIKIREKYNIPKDKFIIAGCGNAEWRKGVDIFALVANLTIKKDSKIHFIWIGIEHESILHDQLAYDLEKMGINENVTLIPPTKDAIEIITGSDLFLVSSREDPFPLVMLEAALCEKPIIGFKNTGGCSEFIGDQNGILSSYLDINDLSNQMILLKNDMDEIARLGQNAKDSVLNKYNFNNSVRKIEDIILEITAIPLEE